ncbi:YqzE family protein [Metabacillus sp. 84]|uniref:YqzE family protein n=1 Tax=Metabacillus sp. 84 TaxID=3404705 RepID=UPI003CE7217C
MSSNDYIKYVTQQVVKYMDTPKEQRQQEKEIKKETRTPFWFKWFGVLPISIMLWVKKRKAKRKKKI